MNMEISRKTIDDRLSYLVSQNLREALFEGDLAVPVAHEDYLALLTDQALSSSRGGKRLRALLLCRTCQALRLPEEDWDAAIDLACAIEIFQTGALVHDDIIDDSDLRRGAPSAHKAFASHLLKRSPTARQDGLGLGLMLGDLLATESVDLIQEASSRLSVPESLKSAIMTAFLTMHRQVEIGQVLDLSMETVDLHNPASIEGGALATYVWKTASYTTIAPLRIAFLACGLDQETSHEVSQAVGLPLGVAFQLKDDLIDVTGLHTGKPVGGDIIEGKRTVLLADALSCANEEEKETLLTLYSARKRNQSNVRTAVEIFRKTGALERNQKRIDSLYRQARSGLEKALDHMQESGLTLDEKGKQALLGLLPLFV